MPVFSNPKPLGAIPKELSEPLVDEGRAAGHWHLGGTHINDLAGNSDGYLAVNGTREHNAICLLYTSPSPRDA